MACISQTRISAGSVAVTFCPPVAVNLTASPVSERPGSFEGDRAAGHEQVQERRLGQLDALAGLEAGGVQGGVLVLDADGGGAVVLVHPGRHGHQPAGEELVVDLELLVARGDVVLVGHDPHLDEVHGVLVNVAGELPGVVLLRVEDAAAGAHPLRQPRVDHAVVAGGVLVDQGALEHPGDDLHVLVRVGVEPGAGVDDVVVVHQQQPVVGVGAVEVVAEGERVLGVQPPELALVAVLGAADVDGGGEVHGAHGGCPRQMRDGRCGFGGWEVQWGARLRLGPAGPVLVMGAPGSGGPRYW